MLMMMMMMMIMMMIIIIIINNIHLKIKLTHYMFTRGKELL